MELLFKVIMQDRQNNLKKKKITRRNNSSWFQNLLWNYDNQECDIDTGYT